ncbi:MAG TPA: LemA family protein [Phycisphaerae bacterium]|nr:LemA family protein [Phycisphaerae bacterium]
MRLGKILGIFAIVVLLGLFIVGGCAYSGYSRVISMDENVNGQWAEVENQLQRRYELIPNLVGTVKGLTDQESKIFLGVAEARKAYFSAGNRAEKIEAAGGVERALSRLLVLRETYPELRSNEAFLKLQDSVEGTENRLAVARKRYNDAVRALNTYIRGPLGRLWAGFAGVDQAKYFEISEAAKEAPKVDFTDKGGEGSGG